MEEVKDALKRVFKRIFEGDPGKKLIVLGEINGWIRNEIGLGFYIWCRYCIEKIG